MQKHLGLFLLAALVAGVSSASAEERKPAPGEFEIRAPYLILKDEAGIRDRLIQFTTLPANHEFYGLRFDEDKDIAFIGEHDHKDSEQEKLTETDPKYWVSRCR